MKIQLFLKFHQLIALHKLTSKLYDLDFLTLESQEKVAVSIGLILADKFDKKIKTIQKKLFFDTTKDIKFTFDFFEAWALKEICIQLIGTSDSNFNKVNIQVVINKLDQERC
ncbi:hypothetical protein G1J88_10260 [Tenacibaculum dicentrarchi]|uniref:hypothetical protein n=1 Tax=Tenacibaculum dicentrarchi TaxID=669041 RepID=UPI000C522D56|nr:hypothetical protein [Tenacibaculum dicentrarchi]MCD8408476.1 hypothetical protein [Tenacibaculum dicentrarchi]MCD8415744.1 hypothetical protein [Tenacibaculum dicentrarchi]MCD8420868.1 hypothetical protein [Tenacibaculum dicentrarchi]MCD8425744.1 hypothetical protein [Tenacibaculum dicentrarchi]